MPEYEAEVSVRVRVRAESPWLAATNASAIINAAAATAALGFPNLDYIGPGKSSAKIEPLPVVG